jgi:hypothetical protein
MKDVSPERLEMRLPEEKLAELRALVAMAVTAGRKETGTPVPDG